MIQLNHIVQFSDIAAEDYTRLTDEEIRDMQNTFGCNHGDSEVNEAYYGEEIEGLMQEEIAGLTILEEEQYFRTYGD